MPVPLCGPKCSICCALFSAWAFIMLVRTSLRSFSPNAKVTMQKLVLAYIKRSDYLVYFYRKHSWLDFFDEKKQGRRSIVTYNLPHPSPMFHSTIPIVCLLSDYLSNSSIVDLDRRFGQPRPVNLCEWFLGHKCYGNSKTGKSIGTCVVYEALASFFLYSALPYVIFYLLWSFVWNKLGWWWWWLKQCY